MVSLGFRRRGRGVRNLERSPTRGERAYLSATIAVRVSLMACDSADSSATVRSTTLRRRMPNCAARIPCCDCGFNAAPRRRLLVQATYSKYSLPGCPPIAPRPCAAHARSNLGSACATSPRPLSGARTGGWSARIRVSVDAPHGQHLPLETARVPRAQGALEESGSCARV